MKESALSLKEKTTQPWFTYIQIDCKYLTPFKTHPWTIIWTISVYDY